MKLNPTDVDSASSYDSQGSKQRKSPRSQFTQRNSHRQGNRSKEVRSPSPLKKRIASNGGYTSDDDDHKRSNRKPNRDNSRRHSNDYRRDDKQHRRNDRRRRQSRDHNPHRERDCSTGDSDSTSSESDTSSERSHRRAPCKEVKVDNYAGDSSIEAYVAQFQLSAKKNGWPRSEWGEELSLRSRGEARNIILPEIGCKPPTYDKTVQQLRERFGEPKHPHRTM